MPSAVIVDLAASEQSILAKDFFFQIMRRELLMISYESRVDVAKRVSNHLDLLGPAGQPLFIWIGPSSRIKTVDLNSIRREFSPATVNRVRQTDDLKSFIKAIFQKNACEEFLVNRLHELLGGKPLLIAYEERHEALVEACMSGLGWADPDLTRKMPIRAGTPAEQWKSCLRQKSASVGGLVFAVGPSHGRFNAAEFKKGNVLVWRGDGVLAAMRSLYRSLVSNLNSRSL